MERARVEAFSDGVIAVAITLLALNLVVPGPGHGPLITQLADRWPSFLAYLLSFFTIGIVWVNHHTLMQLIPRVTRTLLFLNLALLMFVVLMPFATGTAAEYLAHGGSDAGGAMALFAATLLGMSLGFASLFEWALQHGSIDLPAGRASRGTYPFRGGDRRLCRHRRVICHSGRRVHHSLRRRRVLRVPARS